MRQGEPACPLIVVWRDPAPMVELQWMSRKVARVSTTLVIVCGTVHRSAGGRIESGREGRRWVRFRGETARGIKDTVRNVGSRGRGKPQEAGGCPTLP